MTIPRAKRALLASSLMVLAGCQSFYAPLEELTQHDNPVVSAPSYVGAMAFGAAGVPLTIAALPVTIPIASDMEKNMLPLSPMFVTAQIGAMTLGGIPWLLVGWW